MVAFWPEKSLRAEGERGFVLYFAIDFCCVPARDAGAAGLFAVPEVPQYLGTAAGGPRRVLRGGGQALALSPHCKPFGLKISVNALIFLQAGISFFIRFPLDFCAEILNYFLSIYFYLAIYTKISQSIFLANVLFFKILFPTSNSCFPPPSIYIRYAFLFKIFGPRTLPASDAEPLKPRDVPSAGPCVGPEGSDRSMKAGCDLTNQIPHIFYVFGVFSKVQKLVWRFAP